MENAICNMELLYVNNVKQIFSASKNCNEDVASSGYYCTFYGDLPQKENIKKITFLDYAPSDQNKWFTDIWLTNMNNLIEINFDNIISAVGLYQTGLRLENMYNLTTISNLNITLNGQLDSNRSSGAQFVMDNLPSIKNLDWFNYNLNNYSSYFDLYFTNCNQLNIHNKVDYLSDLLSHNIVDFSLLFNCSLNQDVLENLNINRSDKNDYFNYTFHNTGIGMLKNIHINCPSIYLGAMFDSSKIKDIQNCSFNCRGGSFAYCSNLLNVDNLQIKHSDFVASFRGCNNLKRVSNLNIAPLPNCESMFAYCENLEDLSFSSEGFKNLQTMHLDYCPFEGCSSLSNNSLINIAKALPPVQNIYFETEGRPS